MSVTFPRVTWNLSYQDVSREPVLRDPPKRKSSSVCSLCRLAPVFKYDDTCLSEVEALSSVMLISLYPEHDIGLFLSRGGGVCREDIAKIDVH